MGAYKQISPQDTFLTTYVSHKEWFITGSQYDRYGVMYAELDKYSDKVYYPTSGDEYSGSYKQLYYKSLDLLYYRSFNNLDSEFNSIGIVSSSYEHYLQTSLIESNIRHIEDEVILISIPRAITGTGIKPGSFTVGTPVLDESDLYVDLGYIFTGYFVEFLNGLDISEGVLTDSTEGSLIVRTSLGDYVRVGDINYLHGIIVITHPSLIASYKESGDKPSIRFKSTKEIHTHNTHCTILSEELNYTLNPTTIESGSLGMIKQNYLIDEFNPYITTVGLYNQSNELLAVGKLSQPVPKSDQTDMVFVIKIGLEDIKQRLVIGKASNRELCIDTVLSTIKINTTGAITAEVIGLPAGVTYEYDNEIITISGTPEESGIFEYVAKIYNGDDEATATGTLDVIPNMEATIGSTAPELCINTTLSTITHSTTRATGIGTPIGLPEGVVATWANDLISITGIPTVSGTFNYTIPLTGGCGIVSAIGTITVKPDNTATAPSATPSLCINTALTNITHSTTGATGIGTFTGLPPGVTASWSNNTITISGTPTASGTYNYTIPLTGGCGSVSATGTITVTPNNTVDAGVNRTTCINTPITTITLNTTGATGAIVIGLPSGVAGTWASNIVTISGSPSVAGTFTYTVFLIGGCGVVNTTGTITVTPNNTASSASTTPTLCINTPLTSITHDTTGATGIGTATGLPAGVTASWTANTITISGTPTASGTYNYTIPLTGGCGTVSATGTITVTPDNTVSAASSSPTLCINTALTNITHATTGATGIGTVTGLPAGVSASWSSNTITISGTPTSIGTFNYTIPLTGGCGTVSATGTITVSPNNTVLPASSTPTLNINTPMTPSITHATTGATGIGTATGLPAGVTASWSSNTITISGTPTEDGTFNYTIPLTGGCGSVSATGTITVKLPVTINWEVFEGTSGADYVDANMVIAVNGTTVVNEFGNNTGVVNLFKGDSVLVEYYYLGSQPVGSGVTDPRLQLLVDGVIVGNHSITSGVDKSESYTFNIIANTTIKVQGVGTAVTPAVCTPFTVTAS
jgi:hypothetical protein